MQNHDNEIIARSGNAYVKRRKGVDSGNYYIFYYDTEAGKTRCTSAQSADPEVAKLNFAKWVIEHREPVKQTTDDAQVGPIVQRYLLSYASKLPSADAAKYGCANIIWHMGELTVRELHSKRPVEKYIRTRRDEGVKASTINRDLCNLRAALNRAYDDGILTDRPPLIRACSKTEVNAATVKAKVFTLAQLRDLLRRAKAHEYMFRFLVIMLVTGCRPGAARELTPQQINMERGLIDLNPPGRVQQANKRRPVVKLPECAKPYFQSWMDRSRDPKTPFVTKRGLIVRGGYELWGRIIDDMELVGKYVFYSMRRTIATELHARGTDLGQISMQLGHKRADVGEHTEGYIDADMIQVRPEYLKATTAALEQILGEILTPLPDDKVLPFKARQSA